MNSELFIRSEDDGTYIDFQPFRVKVEKSVKVEDLHKAFTEFQNRIHELTKPASPVPIVRRPGEARRFA